MDYKFRNLVFEGGGVKGIAYIGTLEVLQEKEILQNIKRVGGTSAGAIIALLVGLGYSQKELREIFNDMNFINFKDDTIGPIRDLYRLLIHGYGWYKGDAFSEWLGHIIENKTGNKNSTFKEIKESNKYMEMYFQGTNLTKHTVETFSAEKKEYENMPIKDAVRISMSIPLYFKSFKRDDCYYVDGGVLSNYPVRLFDRKKYTEKDDHYFIPEYYKDLLNNTNDNPYVYNKETLGFRLEKKDKIDIFTGRAKPNGHEIKSLFSYTWNLISILMENQDIIHLTGDDFDRTVYVDSLDISTTQFNIKDFDKMALINSGKACTEEYLKKYENDTSTFRNKII